MTPPVAFSALWLGILTSISPCPLATNVLAISFIGKRFARTGPVLLSGLTYTLGRMIAYVAVGVLVVWGILSIPGVSYFLQKYMNKMLGPILILVGMFLTGLLSFGAAGGAASDRAQRLAEKGGILGAGLLGILFALSFCPVSAGLFFLGLIPIALKSNSSFLLPSLFGLGTAVPVIAFALLLALGARFAGQAFQKVTQVEKWARCATGIVFIAIGVYYCLTHVFVLDIGF